MWQETAELEAKAYELEQSTALAAEAKAVLDSWVRYEGQVKIRQQKELSESIIAKIQKELKDPKVLQQILQQSVADVESKDISRSVVMQYTDMLYRDRAIKSPIDEKIMRGIHIFLVTLVVYKPPCAIVKEAFFTSKSGLWSSMHTM